MLAQHLFRIADRLCVDPRWLATGHADSGAPTAALREMLLGVESMTAEQQEAVRRLIGAFRR
jgi:hypothetical protein